MLRVDKLTIDVGNFSMGPISFFIGDEERVSIMGESGAGKTTLLKTIIGLIRPTSGKIILDDKDITDLPPQVRNMSIVTQDPLLFPHMNVYENITFGIPKKGIDKRKKADELIALTHIKHIAKRSIHNLSGGEKQRVALARALFTEPRILLLDEPFSALDEKLRDKLRKEIINLQKHLGFSLIIVTHNSEEAKIVGNRILYLKGGRLIDKDTP